eukprot:CAMPEP_0202048382 /NCGR_PEP_ID=MMETSP0963-20130614/2655_1 /ASSEMBLY_ACC=CAM_ASM_000494 /TAXON_ID=4773 /ORGANISM="Schizochytrium aggregatum, Strain ATCC28209" /LENGTH=488 /DNA_ID=CAMNT_0048613255 /DNA_START=35 /DNA_END=1502 /DNA_ORIENTATION=-
MKYKGKYGLRTSKMWADSFDKLGPVYVATDVSLKNKGKLVLVSSPEYLKVLDMPSDDIRGVFDTVWSLKDYYRINHPDEKLNPFLLRGEEWRKGRMAVNPHMFNVKAAKSYLPKINEAANSAVARIEDYEENLDDFCTFASMDMFNAMALGINLQATAGDHEGRRVTQAMLDALNSMIKIVQQAPWCEHDWLKFGAWTTFEEKWRLGCVEVEALIERSLAQPEQQGFLPAFLAEARDISRFQAVSMVAVLLFAAADTTSATLANTLLNLSRNPQVQARLREELRAELAGGDWNEDARCTYLNWVLYENQRLTPTLTVSHVRSDIEEDVVIEGQVIEKGSTIFFSHYNIAKQVDRPDEFIPERWSDEEKAKRKGTPLEVLDHPVVREPFGFGPRKCVGSRVALLELRSIISRIVQDYEFHLDEETSEPFEMFATVTNHPKPYPHIRFKRIAATREPRSPHSTPRKFVPRAVCQSRALAGPPCWSDRPTA